MIKCNSKEDLNFRVQFYYSIWGSVIVDEDKKIIYTPDDKLYQEICEELRLNEKAKSKQDNLIEVVIKDEK